MKRQKKILKKTGKKPKRNSNPRVFLNYLKNYSKGLKDKSLLTFKKIFHENFLDRISPSLESCAFFIFNYDKEILKPLLDLNINVLLYRDSGSFSECLKEQVHTQKNFKEFHPPKIHNSQNSSFHPKLYLLKFNSFLRVVISSANLFKSDWDDWNNVIWIKDFYKKQPEAPDTENQTNFREFLLHFIYQIMGDTKHLLQDFLDIDLEEYDLREFQVYLIGSYPSLFNLNQPTSKQTKKETQSETTQNSNVSSQTYGLLQVKQVMDKQKTQKFTWDNLKINYLTSSLGPVSIHFLYEIITAFLPHLKKKASLDLSEKEHQKVLSSFNVIYPTEEYVRTSLHGYRKIPLFFRAEYFDKIRFERSILSKYEGKGKFDGDNGLLSHCKILIATQNNVINDDTIIYIGSHNFTKAAWGKFTNRYSKYQISNYELGVLYPPRSGSMIEKQKIINSLNFKIPAQKYESGDYPFLSVDQQFE